MTLPILEDSTAARLRRAFDESFATLPGVTAGDMENFLCVGIKGEPFAVRTRDIAGVATDRRIVPLPTSVPAFLGLTGVRGAIVPIYDLAVLLGRGGSSAPRWIILVNARDTLLGLAFDRFDGHYRVAAAKETPPSSALLFFVTGLPDARPVINVASMLDSILHLPAKGATNR